MHDTDDFSALIEGARDAAERILAPTAKSDDEAETFRRELFAELGATGLCGVSTPEAWGGLGMGYLAYAHVLEEIARVSPSYAVTVAVNGLPQVDVPLAGNAFTIDGRWKTAWYLLERDATDTADTSDTSTADIETSDDAKAGGCACSRGPSTAGGGGGPTPLRNALFGAWSAGPLTPADGPGAFVQGSVALATPRARRRGTPRA